MQRPLPEIIAHRGASKAFHENTIAAFMAAWDQKADGIEGDFQMTLDGIIVCFHDPAIKMPNGKYARIEELSYGELQQLTYPGVTGQDSALVMPTLSEVLDCVPDEKSVFIEIKSGPEIIPALLKGLNASSVQEQQVTIISFNQEVIKKVKAIRPTIKANWLVKFKRGTLSPSPDAASIINTLRKVGADGVGVQASRKIDQPLASAIKNSGFELHAWTIDSNSLAKKFLQMGIDSITTNVPAKIRSYLEDLQRRAE